MLFGVNAPVSFPKQLGLWGSHYDTTPIVMYVPGASYFFDSLHRSFLLDLSAKTLACDLLCSSLC